MEKIVRQFIPDAQVLCARPLTSGLIHQTFKVQIQNNSTPNTSILQQLNTEIFKSPLSVMRNLDLVQRNMSDSYSLASPTALKTTASKTSAAEKLYRDSNGIYWRMFPFLQNSTSFDIPPDVNYVHRAGAAYGSFLSALTDINPQQLEITIPNFHNLEQRFNALELNFSQASSDRVSHTTETFDLIYRYTREHPFDFSTLPIRAVHNDSKLGNLLFDKATGECMAVIDLDTVMPGTIVTDFGDMVRGMCNTATEEERNLALVAFNPKYYSALKKGFLGTTQHWLTAEEKHHLPDGAIYIILEQAIRFLSDYLAGDIYYNAKYPHHNYDRACNQLTLLASMLESFNRHPLA